MFDKWLVARGVLETIANLSFIFALGFIAIADLTAIVQTCPLFVLLGAWAFRGERLGGLRLSLILLGIAGAHAGGPARHRAPSRRWPASPSSPPSPPPCATC